MVLGFRLVLQMETDMGGLCRVCAGGVCRDTGRRMENEMGRKIGNATFRIRLLGLRPAALKSSGCQGLGLSFRV